MSSEHVKKLALATWVVAATTAAIAFGITSVPSWIVMSCVAIVPPLVVRNFWRAPELTMSERIRNARR